MSQQWTLYMGGHHWSEGSAFIDIPRPCVSRLDALRLFRAARDRYRARGCGVWFARAENCDQIVWLADHRGELRRRAA